MNHLRGHLTGSWTIHWAPLLILMPVSVLIETIGRSALGTNPLLVLLASQLGYLTLLAYLGLVWLVFYRKPVAPWFLILPVSVGAGFVLGVSSDYYSIVFGQREQGLDFGIDATVIVWSVGLPLVGSIMNKLQEFIQHRDLLVAKLTNLEQPKLEFELDQEFRELLVARESMDQQGYQLLAEKLRDFADTKVRPLSHKMWEKEIEKKSSFPFWRLVKLAVTENPLPTITYPVLALWLMAVNAISLFGWQRGLFFAAVDAIVFVVTLLVFKRISVFPGSWNAFIFPTIATATIFAARAYIRPELEPAQFIAGIAVVWIWLFTSLTLAGGVVQSIKTQNQILEDLEKDLQDGEQLKYLQMEIENTGSQDLAKFIHGTVQSKLMAYSLKISQAVSEGDVDQAGEARRQAKELISNPLAEYRPLSKTTLEEGLAALKTGWEGIVDIQVEFEPIDESFIQTALEIISEAVSNAQKHGFAERVKVRINNQDSGILIEIIDDGIGPRESQGGYGLRMIDKQTAGNWSLGLNENGEGSTLRAIIPTATNND